MSSELDLAPGPGGWVMATETGKNVGLCWVHFTRRRDQRWHATWQLAPTTTEPLLSWRRIERAVNASEVASARLAERLKESVPELGSPEFLKAFTGYTIPEPPLPLLQRPNGKRLPDEWYAEVASFYRAALARGLRPRTAIAEAAGVSLDVAGRWVAVARRKGKLAETSPGKMKV